MWVEKKLRPAKWRVIFWFCAAKSQSRPCLSWVRNDRFWREADVREIGDVSQVLIGDIGLKLLLKHVGTEV
jgi:hypothetical protein